MRESEKIRKKFHCSQLYWKKWKSSLEILDRMPGDKGDLRARMCEIQLLEKQAGNKLSDKIVDGKNKKDNK